MARKSKETEAEEQPETPVSDDLPQVITSKSPTANIGGITYKMKRRVVLALLKHAVNQTVYIRFEAAIKVGKEILAKPGAASMGPAQIAVVIDLTTGEEMQYIVSAVLLSTLKEEYPKDAYIGKSFAIHKLPPDTKRGKRYATFSVAEIEEVD